MLKFPVPLAYFLSSRLQASFLPFPNSCSCFEHRYHGQDKANYNSYAISFSLNSSYDPELNPELDAKRWAMLPPLPPASRRYSESDLALLLRHSSDHRDNKCVLQDAHSCSQQVARENPLEFNAPYGNWTIQEQPPPSQPRSTPRGESFDAGVQPTDIAFPREFGKRRILVLLVVPCWYT